jgi:hypothetical protein
MWVTFHRLGCSVKWHDDDDDNDDELGSVWNVSTFSCFEIISKTYLSKVKKTAKNITQDIRSLGRQSNPFLSHSEAGVIIKQLRNLVNEMEIGE